MASDTVAADALPLIPITDDDVVVFGRTFPYRYVVAVVFVSALFLGPPADAARSMHGYRIAFVVAATLPALAAVAAWRLVRDADAAETMVPRRRRRPAAPESAPA